MPIEKSLILFDNFFFCYGNLSYFFVISQKESLSPSVCLCAIDSETVGSIEVKFFGRASAGPRAEYRIPFDHNNLFRGAQS